MDQADRFTGVFGHRAHDRQRDGMVPAPGQGHDASGHDLGIKCLDILDRTVEVIDPLDHDIAQVCQAGPVIGAGLGFVVHPAHQG